jgi:hypothetical protein
MQLSALNKTGNVRIDLILGRVRLTTFVEEIHVLHILGVRLWPYLSSKQNTCTVLYCHVHPVCLYNILLHYLTNSKIFEENVITHKMCFVFLYNLSAKFLILRII